MDYHIITDTHFGHKNIIKYCGRPDNFEELIFENIKPNPEDVIIHLGDICMRNDEIWNLEFTRRYNCKKWLVKGNHDCKKNSWYISHGWDFVAESFSLKIYGEDILFSHIPIKDIGYTMNIHGHFHNSEHRSTEKGIQSIRNDKQVLIAMEYTDYKPLTLLKMVEDFQRKK